MAPRRMEFVVAAGDALLGAMFWCSRRGRRNDRDGGGSACVLCNVGVVVLPPIPRVSYAILYILSSGAPEEEAEA